MRCVLHLHITQFDLLLHCLEYMAANVEAAFVCLTSVV